jgi:enoyl-CoA hydratase
MVDREHVRVEVRDGVGVLTLDRPEKRNAFVPSMAREVVAACDELDARDDVGAVVVRGAGGTFCAGADRAVLADAGEDPVDPARFADLGAVYEAFLRVGRLQAPTIAAVRGSAVGAGLNLVLVTDLRIVATDVRLIAGFLRIGIHPGGGHFGLLERVAGREATAAMALFGEEVDGPRAVELGLAWKAVDDAEVEPVALELAGRVAADPALSRLAAGSFRKLAGTGVDGDVAMAAERSAQMWTLRRRALADT